MIWTETHKDLGIVRENVNLTITFEGSDSDGIGIKRVITSCGCTKAYFDKVTNQLKLTYKTKRIPHHLVTQGWYKTKKSVTVLDVKGIKTILTFEVKVIK